MDTKIETPEEQARAYEQRKAERAQRIARTNELKSLLRRLEVERSEIASRGQEVTVLIDQMKADLEYQKQCTQQTLPFPPGSVWVCFSDQTSHAVMSGQFMLEQTFFLPASAMVHPECSPLAILQRLTQRALV